MRKPLKVRIHRMYNYLIFKIYLIFQVPIVLAFVLLSVDLAFCYTDGDCVKEKKPAGTFRWAGAFVIDAVNPGECIETCIKVRYYSI